MKSTHPAKLFVLCLQIILVTITLNACGEQATPTKTIIPTFQSTATIVLTTFPTVASTPTSISTVIPTATPIPTPLPSPTPIPIPTKLVLGNDNSPWGEIVHYQLAGTDKLEPISLNQTLTSSFNDWFQHAPELALATNTIGAKQTAFKLKIEVNFAESFMDGLLKPEQISDVVRFGYSSSGVQFSPALKFTITGIPLPNSMWATMSVVTGQVYLADISSQLNSLNKNVNEVKNFLEQKEIAALDGNLSYLNSMKDNLNQQKISSQDIEVFRTQLENIERESFQSISLAQSRMDKSLDDFNKVKLDKTLIVFRNEDKVRELEKLISDYSNQSNFYLTSLSVKGAASQIRCALPFSRELAVSRLESVQNDFIAWKNKQYAFYQVVESRVSEMDGLFADSKTGDKFKEIAKARKANTDQAFSDANTKIAGTIQKAKSQIQTSSQPMVIIVELDEQSKIKTISRLLNN